MQAMSKQTFSNRFREALWEAHRQKCFHGGGELLLRDMEVDHLVPEALKDDQEALATLCNRVGLPSDFDITAVENLVPSCPRCNGRKGELILGDGALAIALAKARDISPRVRDLELKKRTEHDLESTLRAVARSIDGKKFTKEQLLSSLSLLHNYSDVATVTGVAPAAQPNEIRQLGFDPAAPSHLIVSSQAAKEMTRHNIRASDIGAAVYDSVKAGKVEGRRLPGDVPKYMIRAGRDLRILFEVRGETLVIQSLFHRSDNRRYPG